MSREIKFRAWDKEFSVMRDMHDLTFIRSEDYSSLLIEIINGFDGKDTRFHLMQYTGLKDRNGVEIYEGDLLKCDSGDLHQMVFESYFACFNSKHLKSGEVSDISRDVMCECFEVVGNIHENPDLLK